MAKQDVQKLFRFKKWIYLEVMKEDIGKPGEPWKVLNSLNIRSWTSLKIGKSVFFRCSRPEVLYKRILVWSKRFPKFHIKLPVQEITTNFQVLDTGVSL